MGHQLETKTYDQGKLVFHLTPRYIIVCTSLQTFFLLPRQSYWYKRLNLVRAMIEVGEIRDLNDLAYFCGDGIEWRATSLPIALLVYSRRQNEEVTV